MSNYDALLRAGWSPNSIDAMSISITCDLTVDISNSNDNDNDNMRLSSFTQTCTPIKSAFINESKSPLPNQFNKENYHIQQQEKKSQQDLMKETRLQEAGWSPSSLLCAMASPPPPPCPRISHPPTPINTLLLTPPGRASQSLIPLSQAFKIPRLPLE